MRKRNFHCPGGQVKWALGSLVCTLALLANGASQGLVIDAGDGTGNTSTPEPDPGWAHVGQHLGGPSAVYLGCGWMITTNHVGVTIVVINEERYDPVAGSITPILNEDGTKTDLVLFRIDGDPGLAPLKIPTKSLMLGENVVMIGYGASRGPSLTVEIPFIGLEDGFSWIDDQTKRWGTNQVSSGTIGIEETNSHTLALSLAFDRVELPGSTRQESSAARGDSGGAVFAPLNPVFPEWGWGLAGLMFSVSSFQQQPPRSTIYGNVTWVADLAIYRDQIANTVWAPRAPGTSPDEPLQAICPDSPPEPKPPLNSVSTLAAAGALLATAVGLVLLRRRRSLHTPQRHQIER